MPVQGAVFLEHPRFATEIAQLWPPQEEWTEADYFELPESNRIIELSNGEIIMPPHPTNTHQRVVLSLVLKIQSFVEAHDMGIVRFSPLPVWLWPGKIREPDILFVSHTHADRVGEQFYGPPDLVVEVTSPSTARTDRRDKHREYAQAGIGEYWLVDPDEQTVEVFVLEGESPDRDQDRTYALLVRAGRGETIRSLPLEGFEVGVDGVFAE